MKSTHINMIAGYLISMSVVTAYFLAEPKFNLSYLAGRGIFPWYGILYSPMYHVFLPAMCFFTLVSALCFRLNSRIELGFRILSAFAICVISFIPFSPVSLRHSAYLRGFRDQIGTDNLAKVKSWAALTLDAQKDTSGDFRINDRDIPDYVKNLWGADESDVEIEGQKEGGRCMVITYGGGFGHWGIFIFDHQHDPGENSRTYLADWGDRTFGWYGP